MVSFINSWAQGIILAVIISCVIEIILPGGNIKKYVKTVIGIYVLFVIVHPLISAVLNKKLNVDSIIDDTISQMSEYESTDITIETKNYIEKTYKQKLQEDMSQKLNEKGYDINSLNLYIETENENSYGQINGIAMEISKIQKTEESNNKNITQNEVNKVESIDIKISDSIATNKTDNIEKETVTEQEIEAIKDYLNLTYEIDKEKIYINE